MMEISYMRRTRFDDYLNFPAAFFRYYDGTFDSIRTFCGKVLTYVQLDQSQEYKIRLNLFELKYWLSEIYYSYSRKNDIPLGESQDYFYKNDISFSEMKCLIGVKAETLKKIGNENPERFDMFYFDAFIIELAIKSMIPKDKVYINIKWPEVIRRAQGIFKGEILQEHWTNKYLTKRGKEKILKFLRTRPYSTLAYISTVKALQLPGKKKPKGTSSPFFSFKLEQCELENLLEKMGYEVKDMVSIRKNQKKRSRVDSI